MKTKHLFTITLGFASLLTACTSSNQGNTMTSQISLINVVNNLTTGETTASLGGYSVKFDWEGATAQIQSNSIVLGGQSYPLLTSAGAYKVESGGTTHITGLTGMIGSGTALPMEFIKCTLPLVYTDPADKDQRGQFLKMSFLAGGMFEVKTLAGVSTFFGNTTTSYQGVTGEERFSSNNIGYAIAIRPSEMKANLLMYNAKFAEAMPMTVNIVLEDLPIQITPSGYSIKSSDVVPKSILSYEVGEAIPAYTFTNLEVSSDMDFTNLYINFTVAGKYEGYFSGTCVAPSDN